MIALGHHAAPLARSTCSANRWLRPQPIEVGLQTRNPCSCPACCKKFQRCGCALNRSRALYAKPRLLPQVAASVSRSVLTRSKRKGLSSKKNPKPQKSMVWVGHGWEIRGNASEGSSPILLRWAATERQHLITLGNPKP